MSWSATIFGVGDDRAARLIVTSQLAEQGYDHEVGRRPVEAIGGWLSQELHREEAIRGVISRHDQDVGMLTPDQFGDPFPEGVLGHDLFGRLPETSGCVQEFVTMTELVVVELIEDQERRTAEFSS